MTGKGGLKAPSEACTVNGRDDWFVNGFNPIDHFGKSGAGHFLPEFLNVGSCGEQLAPASEDDGFDRWVPNCLLYCVDEILSGRKAERVDRRGVDRDFKNAVMGLKRYHYSNPLLLQ